MFVKLDTFENFVKEHQPSIGPPVVDTDLPEFRTNGGVHSSSHGGSGPRVTSPTLMWVKALDLLMDKIKVTGVDLSAVVAISGSGQQHGSVYWRSGARQTLNNLKHDRQVNIGATI